MTTDGRRVGHAQRRRIGAPSNVYDNTIKPPTFGVGDVVQARGRYGRPSVTSIIPNITKPISDAGIDGHVYEVSGGKGGRTTRHFSDELRRNE